ncbi:MAG: hypothetical protein LBB48_10590, partial [Treponema sp.]|nr:hypothetical protein [Treponema sp.]
VFFRHGLLQGDGPIFAEDEDQSNHPMDKERMSGGGGLVEEGAERLSGDSRTDCIARFPGIERTCPQNYFFDSHVRCRLDILPFI